MSSDFVVFPALWSGAEATHTPAQNTSSKICSEILVRFAADYYESPPANPDFSLQDFDESPEGTQPFFGAFIYPGVLKYLTEYFPYFLL